MYILALHYELKIGFGSGFFFLRIFQEPWDLLGLVLITVLKLSSLEK